MAIPHNYNQRQTVSMGDMITHPVTYPPGKIHDDLIKWKHFPREWPFVRGIHRSPVNSPHEGQ